jgi:acylphosphatase
MIRRRVVVEGRVQGVGFRATCARRARSAGLAGSVTNLPDGRVEAVFEGPPDRVDVLVDWCAHGPTSALVRRVHVSDVPPTGAHEFLIS